MYCTSHLFQNFVSQKTGKSQWALEGNAALQKTATVLFWFLPSFATERPLLAGNTHPAGKEVKLFANFILLRN